MTKSQVGKLFPYRPSFDFSAVGADQNAADLKGERDAWPKVLSFIKGNSR